MGGKVIHTRPKMKSKPKVKKKSTCKARPMTEAEKLRYGYYEFHQKGFDSTGNSSELSN